MTIESFKGLQTGPASQLAALVAVRDTGRMGFMRGLHRWVIRNLETEGLIRFTRTGYTLTPAGERRIGELMNTTAASEGEPCG